MLGRFFQKQHLSSGQAYSASARSLLLEGGWVGANGGKGHLASAGAQAYNESGGKAPSGGPRGQPLVGVKLKDSKHLGVKRRSQICQHLCILQIQ